MSTRSNIVVKQTIDGKSRFLQIYKHSDGYPSGTGTDVLEILNSNPEETSGQKVYDSIVAVNSRVFEPEGDSLRLHGDIEYLYVIDMDTRKFRCYSLDIWDGKNPDTRYVFGTLDYSMKYYLAFECDFDAKFETLSVYNWWSDHK